VVPKGVVTRISTVPDPAGATAVIDVALVTLYEVAAVPPKLTPVAEYPVPEKPVPVITTLVPEVPAAG
jgi:hypothetical protein